MSDQPMTVELAIRWACMSSTERWTSMEVPDSPYDGYEWGHNNALDVLVEEVLRQRKDYDAKCAEVKAWQDRFRALVGEDQPDGAGNAVLTLQRRLIKLEQELIALKAEHYDHSTL